MIVDISEWRYRCFVLYECVCVCVVAFVWLFACTVWSLLDSSWCGGSCSLYFHESCSIKRTIPRCAPYCPPVQSTLMAVSCSTPYWLYITPTFLSLRFLFAFADAPLRLSHWSWRKQLLEQRWTALLQKREGVCGCVYLNQYSGSSIGSKGAEWARGSCTYGCYVLRLSGCACTSSIVCSSNSCPEPL